MTRRQAISLACVMAMAAAGCGEGSTLGRLGRQKEPVEVPALISTEMPFRYPPGLYIERIQDDVTLRLHIDSLGRVVPESTKIEKAARYALFDSAAIEGAPKLLFRAARRGEHRIAYTVLFPIKFRVPNGPPMPGDSVHDTTVHDNTRGPARDAAVH